MRHKVQDLCLLSRRNSTPFYTKYSASCAGWKLRSQNEVMGAFFVQSFCELWPAQDLGLENSLRSQPVGQQSGKCVIGDDRMAALR